jgi:hypothetical protein
VAIAVDFNDQQEFGAIKINNIVVYRFLTEKFEMGELPHAKNFVPDFVFGLGRILAIFACTVGQVFVVREKGGFRVRLGHSKPLPGTPLIRNNRQTPPPPPLIRGGAIKFPP